MSSMKNKKSAAIPKNVLILGLVSFLTDASSDMIYPLLPLFLSDVLGSSMLFIGLVEGVAESTASILKIFSGWLSDRLGKRKVLVVLGYGISSVGKPILSVVTTGWHLGITGLRKGRSPTPASYMVHGQLP